MVARDAIDEIDEEEEEEEEEEEAQGGLIGISFIRPSQVSPIASAII